MNKDRNESREHMRSLGTIIFSLRDRIPFFKFFRGLSPAWQRAVKLILPLLSLIVIVLLPVDLDTGVKNTLGIFVCIAMMWTFESLPLPATALLVPVLLTLFGVFPAATALQPYADPIVFLMIGGLILAEAFRKNGLDKRLAYGMVLRAKGEWNRTLLYLMLVSAFLSMWISNTATVAILIPVVLGIATRTGVESRKRSVQMLLGIGIGSSAGGMMTVTGSTPNAIASGLLAQHVPWTFLDWMQIGVPVGLGILFLAWFILMRLFPNPEGSLEIDALRKDLQAMGPLGKGERRTLLVFIPTVFLWIFGANIAGIFGLPESFMSAAVVALTASVGLFVVRSIEWDDARSISWDVFLIVGSGLAIGEALSYSGAAQWIANNIEAGLMGMELFIVLLVIISITVALTNFISNTATAAMLIPILIGLSGALDLSVQILVLACALSVSLSFITPIGTPPFTLIYSTKIVSRGEMARTGIAVALPAIIMISIALLLFSALGIF